MANLLLLPSNFKDSNNASPPSQLASNPNRYQFTEAGNMFLRDNNRPFASGDRLAFQLTVAVATAGTQLIVRVGGETVHVFNIVGGNTYTFDSATTPILQTGAIEIQLIMASGSLDLDAAVIPLSDTGTPLPPGADTYSLKGFFSYGALSDNDEFEVAPLGELSVRSRTYTKDRQLFGIGSGTTPSTSVDVTAFSSKKADGGIPVRVPGPYSELLLDVGLWSYVQSVSGIFTSNPDVYRQQILAQYTGKITDVVVGPMVQQGSMWLPSYITCYFKPDAISPDWGPERAFLEKSRVKMWFSDDAFGRQYDEYQYEFVAPLDNLDDFFLNPNDVEARVRAVTVSQLAEKVRDKAGNNPYTLLRVENFNYHDPDNAGYLLPTNWSFIIYGAAGNNIDAMKAALVVWILAHSTHTREEWAEIFPDIFTSTEFIITPMWNQYAVPNMTLDMGVYSPSVEVQNGLTIARTTCTGTGYTQQHIDENLTITGNPFKSIALLVCGGPENRNGVKKFRHQWPDYMNVATTSIDFDRMSPATQDWIMMLLNMLKVAETMDEFSDIPQNMTRLKRTNAANKTMLYLVSSFQNVQYLVLARSSLYVHFPPDTVAPLQLTCEGAEGVTSMPNGSGGADYNTTFEALGGATPYTYALLSAAGGPILSHSLDPVSGAYEAQLSTGGGDASVVARVTDANNQSVTVTFSLHVIGI